MTPTRRFGDWLITGKAVGGALLRVWSPGTYAPPGGEGSARFLHGTRLDS